MLSDFKMQLKKWIKAKAIMKPQFQWLLGNCFLLNNQNQLTVQTVSTKRWQNFAQKVQTLNYTVYTSLLFPFSHNRDFNTSYAKVGN